MCLTHRSQQGISKHMLQMKSKHVLKLNRPQVLLLGCKPSSPLYMSLNLCSSCKTEHNTAFTVIPLHLVPSLLTSILAHLSFLPPQASPPWLRRAGSYQRQYQQCVTGGKHSPSSLSTQSTAKSTRWTTCGHVCVGVQVLGGQSPHASSYAGYLLLVMVTLLAHGRRGVMMEDGAR